MNTKVDLEIKQQIIQVLKEMKELLSTENRWTKDFAAKDAQGNPTLFTNSKAVSFCLIGAYRKAYFKYKSLTEQTNKIDSILYEILHNQVKKLHHIPDSLGLGHWNDSPMTTYDQVIEVIDNAIEELSQEGA